MRLRATVAYDGTGFSGFQRQTSVRSVQGELETAFERVCRQSVTVLGAGRTDAGVHATGQVIACDADWKHTLPELQRALNSVLPNDVAVSDVAECHATFHPRYSARSRVYEYQVLVAPVRRPVQRLYAWQIGYELDVDRMGEAAGVLVGEHDFVAFGSAPQGDVTVRRVFSATWNRDGMLFRFTIEANAFLFRMVRRTVAVLVRAGSGQITASDVADILASKDPRRVKGVAPACGLCLVNVNYEGE